MKHPTFIRRFLSAQQGVSTVEFVLIFPFFFLLLFGGIEVTRLLLIQQRLERAGYVLADITTQYDPATVLAASGEINVAMMNGNVFPQLSRIMNPYNDASRQAIIVTSVQRSGGATLIKWQIASAANTLSGCDGAATPTCVTSVVNGLEPSLIGPAVKDTLATFPPEQRAIFNVMPNGTNVIVSEVFYFYQPLLQRLLQQTGAAGGTGMAQFHFYTIPRIYVKRTYFSPRNGPMLALPPSFPAT